MKKILLLLVLMLTPYVTYAREAPQKWTTVFQNCPDYIRAHLILKDRADVQVLMGASREYSTVDMYNTALMLTREHTLLGLQWVNGQEDRFLHEYSCLPWPLEELVSIEATQKEQYGEDFRLVFSDGSSCVVSTGAGSSWRMMEWNATDGTRIAWTSGQMNINGSVYPSAYACWLSDLPAVRVFPNTAEEALAVVRRSWEGLDAPTLAMGNANLREKPSASSRSLGMYHKALMHVLEEQNGWYRVRIGHTEGWMSGTYVQFFSDRENMKALHASMPTAVISETCPLRAGRNDPRTLTLLSPGKEVRILAHTKDGWLHVLVPEGELGWELGMMGTYGYVKYEEVQTDLQIETQ